MGLSATMPLLRGYIFGRIIRLRGGRVGRRLQVDKGFRSLRLPHRGWLLGDDVYFGVGSVVDAPRGSLLQIGSRVRFMHYSVLGVSKRVTIDEDSQIAEFTSVRDHDHGLSPNRTIRSQPLVADAVHIGRDVWVAARVAILRGVHIGDGTVVGANSVVRHSLPANVIVAGVPAKIIRSRDSETINTTQPGSGT